MEPVYPPPVQISFQVINQYRHDTAAFTEGFSFYQGKLYESTGAPDSPNNNGTWIGSIDLNAGKYQRYVDLWHELFRRRNYIF